MGIRRLFRRLRSAAPGPDRPIRRLHPEALEERILLSATWVDAETGDPNDGPTDGDDLMIGSADADVGEGGAGQDALFGHGGDDYLDGGAGDDRLDGGAGDDIVAGGAGDDVIAGGEGDDLLVGGDGQDTLTYEGASGGVDVNLGDHVASGEGDDQVHGFEHVVGSDHDDTLAGSSAGETLEGGAGDDLLAGLGGNDVLLGGAGRDLIDGGSGDDVLGGDDGDDVLDGGSGDDVLSGGAGDDVLDGGDGIDTVSFEGAAGGVAVDLAVGTTSGEGNDELRGIERVEGSDHDDELRGDAAANVLRGGDGDDVLEGRGGADELRGGAGDDLLIADEDDTVIHGGAGTDHVDLRGATAGVTLDLAASEVESVHGSDHDDTFAFTAASDGDVFTVVGGPGTNVLDLSNHDVSDVAIDVEEGIATVELPGGGSFEIRFSDIDHVEVGGLANGPALATAADLVTGEGQAVEISSMAMTGPGGDASITWTQISGPAVTIEGAQTSSPSLTTPNLAEDAVIRLEATISDGQATSTQIVTIGVSAVNEPVVTDAGPDRFVHEGDSVLLDGTVVDPEGGAVSVHWVQVSGPPVTLDDSTSLTPSFDVPNLASDEDIVFRFVASDGEHETSDLVTVHVSAVNETTIADAGADQLVAEGDQVMLTGGGTDPEHAQVTFQWRQIAGPPVVLSDPTAAQPTFEAPEGVVNTDLVFELTASDGVTEGTDLVTITVEADDDAPRFMDLPSITADEHTVVTLGATAEDPEGSPLAYTWRQLSGPTVVLDGADGPSPTFTTPEGIVNTWLTFEVQATDGTSTTTGTVDVLVEADNDAPNVDAGTNVDGVGGASVSLAATASDPEGRLLTYEWTQIGGPAADLDGATSATPDVLLPEVNEPSTLTFQVAVSDGHRVTIDTVTIEVDPAPAEPGDGGDPGDGGGGGEGGGQDPGGGGGDPNAGQPLEIDVPATVDVVEGQPGQLTADIVQSTGATTIQWRQLEGPTTIELTGDDTAAPTFDAPDLATSERYLFEVTVTDETGTRTAEVVLRVDADNDAPELISPGDLIVDEGDLVMLDAGASDPEGQSLMVRWVQLDGPPVRMTDPNADVGVFVAPDVAGPVDLTFELQVSDGEHIRTELVTVTVEGDDDAPTVDAGNERTVNEGANVRLMPVVVDPEEAPLTYHWEQVSGPPVALTDPAAASPSFDVPDAADDHDLVFRLTVSDGVHDVSDEVVVHVVADDDPPTVDAGPFQQVNEGDLVTLTAAASDPEDGALTWSWRQIGGKAVQVDASDGPSPTFTAPEGLTNSLLTFEVSVTDGPNVVTDTVVVQVNADDDAPVLDAGPDLVAAEESTVQLAATVTDPEGRELEHTWRQVSGPPIALSDPASLEPTFQAPNVLTDTEIVLELTTTDGEHTVVDTITVTVTGANDLAAPVDGTTLMTEDVTGSVVLAAIDPDLGDAIESFRIESLPDVGTLLIDGAPASIGDVIDADAMAQGAVVFEPPADFSGETSIEFSAFDGEQWSAAVATHSIVVVADADAPIVTTADATGVEDQPIPLAVTIATTDVDGSESITKVRVTGAPPGSILTDGVQAVTAWNGSATITDLDLSNLRIIPAEDHDTDFTLTVTATSTEDSNGDTRTGAAQIDVHIDPVNDPPIAKDATVQVAEDQTAVIMLDAVEVDTSDAAESFRIGSLPANGTLRLDDVAVEVGDVISSHDIGHARLTFEPAADWSGSTAFSFDAFDGQQWSANPGTFTVEVGALADAPLIALGTASGAEDTTIALEPTIGTTDADGSESIQSIRVSGAPIGSILSDGTHEAQALGSPIDVANWDLDALSITPPRNYDRDFELTFEVTTVEPTSGDTETAAKAMLVRIDAVNDAPIVQAGFFSTTEDESVAIRLGSIDPDSGDVAESYRIESLPEHGTLRLDGTVVAEGEVIGADAIADDRLVFEPDADWSGATSLRFSVFDGDLWSEDQGVHTIEVTGVADAPVIDVNETKTEEDRAVALSIDASSIDLDGSEAIAIRVEGVPDGASLSAGTDLGDGTWSLSPDELDGLALAPRPDYSGTFDLTVTAIASEDGTVAQSSDVLTVTVTGVADAPVIDVNETKTEEDRAVALSIEASSIDLDGSEAIAIRVEGVPDGASLSAGTDLGDGTWSLSPDELDGLALAPRPDYSGTFDLTVTAIASEDGTVAQSSDVLSVTVIGVADAPSIEAEDTTGTTGAPIDLSIVAASTDADGSESVRVLISGLPEGSMLSAGTMRSDGVWIVPADRLPGIAFAPPPGFTGTIELSITAESTEGAEGITVATTETSMSITVVEPAPSSTAPEPVDEPLTEPGVEEQPPAAPMDDGAATEWSDDDLAMLSGQASERPDLDALRTEIDALGQLADEAATPAPPTFHFIDELSIGDDADERPVPVPPDGLAPLADVGDPDREDVLDADDGLHARSIPSDAPHTPTDRNPRDDRAGLRGGELFAALWGLLRARGADRTSTDERTSPNDTARR